MNILSKTSKIILTIFISLYSLIIIAQPAGSPVYFEGEIYSTIVVGSQCWMTENLNVGSIINGNEMPANNGVIEKTCFNDNPVMCETYGGLYRWNELMQYQTAMGSQGICPTGWHIPSDFEWLTLINGYPSSPDASLITGGSSGFDAVFGGYANNTGGFYQLGLVGAYYTSTKVSFQAYRRSFDGTGLVSRALANLSDGYSVRCLRNSLSLIIPFDIAISGEDALCNGTSTGSVSLFVSGTSNPTFLWSNGSTVEDLINVSAGTYSVTVTEGTQTLTETYTIGEPSSLFVTASIGSPITCFDGSNGVLTASGSGGVSPYTYEWSNGQTGSSSSNLAQGNHYVTITDANGCEAFDNINLPNSTQQVFFTSVASNLNCFEDNTGFIDISPQGTGSFLYNWSNYQVSQDLNNLSVGSYTVTITHNGFCSVGNFEITQPGLLDISYQATNPSGAGLFDGSIDATISGGTTPFIYSWSNGESTEDLSGIPAGVYSLTVLDVNQCTNISDQIILVEPGINIISQSVNQISCNGLSDGSIFIQASSNGTIYYDMGSASNGYGFFGGLSAGNYSVTVTDNLGGSVILSNLIVTEPDPILFSASQDGGCAGTNVTITVSGGTLPLTYSNNGTTYQTSNIFTNVTPGNYVFYVKDGENCENSQNVTVNSFNAISIIESITHPICFGSSDGSIQISVLNGVPPISYSWSNGSTLSLNSNLSAGIYWLTVTSNGCSVTGAYTLTNPQEMGITLIGNDINGLGGSDGSIQTYISGTTSPYLFNWSNGMSTQNISGLTAGQYVLTVTDINLCTNTSAITLVEDVQAINITFTSVDITCNGGSDGSIEAFPTGGVSPYSYIWSNGETTSEIIALSSGTYSVTVSDNIGNSGSDFIYLSNPSSINLSIQSGQNYNGYDVSCFNCTDGMATVFASGGSYPYTYLWSNGETVSINSGLNAGIHSVTVSDSNGCSNSINITLSSPAELIVTINTNSDFNGFGVSCPGAADGSLSAGVSGGVPPFSGSWSTGVQAYNLNNLVAGSYSVTVIDDNGATSSANVVLVSPDVISITPIVNDVTTIGGSDGSISLILSGGVSPFAYLWSTSATSQFISNLSTGTYTVTVTDQNSCVAEESITIVESILPLSAIISGDDVLCYGGSNGFANILAEGGTSPYTYSWSNGNSTTNISNLIIGDYYVTVYDQVGDSVVEIITISAPDGIITTLSGTDITTPGGNDGSIILSGSGGIAPYSILWSNGETTLQITNLIAGNYIVTITDSNGCLAEDSLTLIEMTPGLNISLNVINIDCNGSDNGILNVNITGGESPYSYLWSTGSTQSEITGLSAGEYFCTVYDNFNDSVISSASIIEPAVLDLSFAIQDVSCFGDNDGQAEVLVTGGTFPYSYLWSNGSSDSNSNNLIAGNYTVYVNDNNNCYSIMNVEIVQPVQYVVVSSITNTSGQGNMDGSISIIVSGNTPPYTYLWSNGVTSDLISGVSSGTYSVQIQDVNLCDFWSILEVGTDIYGCMDVQALNYNPNANIDDGSCTYNQSYLHVIDLDSAWSLFSTYINPVTPDISNVLSNVVSDVIIVKDGNGQTYWPQFSVNLIGNMTIGEGYQINMADFRTLVVEGVAIIPELTPVTLPANWSILGYLRTTAAPIQTMLSPVVTNIEIVKNDQGSVYWPAFGVDLIGSMLPGKGYQINMNVSDVLLYTSNSINYSSSVNKSTSNLHPHIKNTGRNMTIGFPYNSWNESINIGDEILAMNSNNEIVGSCIFEGGNTALTIWGDDELTPAIDGLELNESVELFVIDQSGNQNRIIVESWLQGDDRYKTNGISIVGEISVFNDIVAFKLFQNKPNPFSSTTVISFNLAQASGVSIKVYNLTGELVQDVGSLECAKGINNIQFDGNKLPAGIYMYRVMVGDDVSTRLMNIVK